MNKNNSKLWIFGIIVLILIILIVLITKKPTEDGPIKIGFVAPLTGDVASIGQNMKSAAELAVTEINNAGGIDGRLVSLIAEDGKCDGKDAVSAVTKLINFDQVPVIVGGACSSETVASAPIAEEAGVVMLSPLSSNPSITTAGDYIFRNYPSDSFQGVKAAEFAVNILDSENIAVLSCMDDWCQGIQQVFKDEVAALGSNIIIEERYGDQNINDLKTQLTKIKASNPDLLYFVGYTDGTIAGLKQAQELGLEVNILGGDAWNDPKIITDAGTASEGIMYLMPSSVESPEFEENFLSTVGGDEITIGSRETYDAVKILAQIIDKVGTDSTKIKNELYKIQNYNGVSGNISFDENGDLVSASYDIMIIKDGKPVEY